MHFQQYRGVLILLSIAVAGCSDLPEGVTVPSSTPATFNAAQAPTVEFALPDMMCEEGCAQAVEDILERQPGVKAVRVDFEGKTAIVAVEEGRFDAEEAIAALVDKGFDNSALAANAADAANDAAMTPDAESQAAPAAQ